VGCITVYKRPLFSPNRKPVKQTALHGFVFLYNKANGGENNKIYNLVSLFEKENVSWTTLREKEKYER